MPYEFDHEAQEKANQIGRDIGTVHLCCPDGCYPCGSSYYGSGRHDGDCCQETICNDRAWTKQVEAYLTVEEKFNIALWLEVEKEFKESLASRPKVRVRYEGMAEAPAKKVHHHVVAKPR
jgi:hypothetical protein